MHQNPVISFVALDGALGQHINTLYILDVGSDGLDDWLVPDWGVLGFALNGDWTWSVRGGADPADRLSFGTLFGPTSRGARVTATPGARVIGVSLTPMGWSQLIDRPAAGHLDRATPLQDLFEEAAEMLEHLQGAPDNRARIARLSRWFAQRLWLSSRPDPQVAHIHSAIIREDVHDVAGLVARTGLSESLLERLCPPIFGLPPAEVLRRERFRRAITRFDLHPDDQPIENFQSGYADAAQLERDFQHFMGTSLGAYHARPRPLARAGGRALAELMIAGARQASQIPA